MVRSPDGEEWLSIAEVGDRLAVTPARVRKWISRGRVRSFLFEGRRYVSLSDAAVAERAGRRK